jgi:hypothetical protein
VTVSWMVTADIDSRRRRVAQLHHEGHTAAYIARSLNVSTKTVERDRGVFGLSPPGPPRFTPQELSWAREMLDEGCNYAEVARTLRRSPGGLRRHLPGYELNIHQVSELGAMGRWLNRLDRKTG